MQAPIFLAIFKNSRTVMDGPSVHVSSEVQRDKDSFWPGSLPHKVIFFPLQADQVHPSGMNPRRNREGCCRQQLPRHKRTDIQGPWTGESS